MILGLGAPGLPMGSGRLGRAGNLQASSVDRLVPKEYYFKHLFQRNVHTKIIPNFQEFFHGQNSFFLRQIIHKIKI